jgi:diadenosine tetraphosphate (Ap4A) HIT family hydrolase
MSFHLDGQLEADTWTVCDMHLCRVLLARNAAWPWLILVPMRENKVEIIDLSEPEQGMLWREIEKASRALQRLTAPDKLNVAAIGNVVRQLHIHIVSRRMNDPAWPSPIWGSGFSASYSIAEKEEFIEQLYDQLHR